MVIDFFSDYQRGFQIEICPRGADGNAKSVDPDQGLHCLPRYMSVQKQNMYSIVGWYLIFFFRSAVKAAMLSIFHSFPPPVGPGIVTVGEQNGELAHVESGQTTAKVSTK